MGLEPPERRFNLFYYAQDTGASCPVMAG